MRPLALGLALVAAAIVSGCSSTQVAQHPTSDPAAGRDRSGSPPPPPPAPADVGGETYVEELPEAITKVQPVIPSTILRPIDETVLVQTLVGTDGRIKDARVVKSVPMLDDAALAAARQWVFKPAMSNGKPVEVWVAIPVRFKN